MKLSVVIPCLNEEGYIGNLLRDLSAQDYRDFEVIVSDSGSVDKTIAAAEKYRSHIDLKVAKAPYIGLSLARNTGAQDAKGKYLLFLDADLRIPRHTLSTFMEAIENSKKEVLLSARLSADSRHPVDLLMMWVWTTYFRLLSAVGIPRPSGGDLLIKKSCHEKLHGFDANKEPAEDSDYGRRAKSLGTKTAYLNNLVLKHSPRRFRQDGLLRYISRGIVVEFYKLIGIEKSTPVKYGHYHREFKKDSTNKD